MVSARPSRTGMTIKQITIKPLDLFGPHCVKAEHGEQLFASIVPALSDGHDVRLDFSGVQTLVSLFLNPAIGRLYGKFEQGFLDGHLHISGLDEVDQNVVSVVIQNAKDFYSKGKAERQRQDQIVKDVVDEKP